MPKLKIGSVGSKITSLGQFFVKPLVHSRGHSFDPNFMKLCQNHYRKKSRPGLKIGHVRSKSRSVGQILVKP